MCVSSISLSSMALEPIFSVQPQTSKAWFSCFKIVAMLMIKQMGFINGKTRPFTKAKSL
jgi:hypothetical protein